jgi:hypothetical protein
MRLQSRELASKSDEAAEPVGPLLCSQGSLSQGNGAAEPWCGPMHRLCRGSDEDLVQSTGPVPQSSACRAARTGPGLQSSAYRARAADLVACAAMQGHVGRALVRGVTRGKQACKV